MAKRNTPVRGSGAGMPRLPRQTVQELSALVERTRQNERGWEYLRGEEEQRVPIAEAPTVPEMPAQAARPPEAKPPEEPPRAPVRPAPDLRVDRISEALSEMPTVLDAVPPPRALVRMSPRESMEMLLLTDGRTLPETPGANVRALPQAQGPGTAGTDVRLILMREPDSPRAAAYRVLRYRLEQQELREGDPLRTTVLAVCGPRSGHGATTAAANLALALSESNRARVCLMEGNLRRPALANLFRMKPPMCLVERLQQDRDQPLQPWCVAELTPTLHVLCASAGAPRISLTDGPAFGAAVEAMRRAGYRYVIIDGPEVLGIADMNLIEELVDGVILVARGGQTKATDLKLAAAQLSDKKLRGVVLVDAEGAV